MPKLQKNNLFKADISFDGLSKNRQNILGSVDK
jgi:hypothetical protein